MKKQILGDFSIDRVGEYEGPFADPTDLYLMAVYGGAPRRLRPLYSKNPYK